MTGSKCPKCGVGTFGAAMYRSGIVWSKSEWLEYSCRECGYVKRTPTADKQPLRTPDQQLNDMCAAIAAEKKSKP